MSRNALSLLSAVALAATVSVAPVVASPSDDSSSSQTAESPSAVTVQRLAGKNRYETATEVSDQWSATGKRVYIVSGHNFPDALGAASRAGVFNSPVLLTKSDHLPSETVSALERLKPKRITVIGGEGSVSNTVLSELGSYAGDEGVERLTGENRYATSARIAAQYTKGRDRVFLASGEDYPDALSAAAVAGAEHEPLLLTKPGQLPSEVAKQLERLAPGQVVVVGGPQAIGDAVAKEAATYSTSGNYHRVAGTDRYKTSAAVAKEFSTDLTPGYVASGLDYADALVVSALAARDEVPVVLTPADRVASGTREALNHLDPNRIFVVGGPEAVSEGVVGQLADPGNPPPPAPEPPAPEPPSPEGFSAGAYNQGAPTADQDFSDLVGGIDLGHGSSYYTSGNFRWGLKARDVERIDSGMTLLMGMASKDWNEGGPDSYMAWADIAAGVHDEEIRGWGRELATVDGTVRLAFDIEPNVKLNQGKVPKSWKPEDYAAASRRISTLVKEEAPNVDFTFWVSSTQKDLTARMYPGDDYVDVICWDAYVNRAKSPDMTPLEVWSDFKYWMDDQSWGKGKTYGICETGFHNGHPDAKGAAFWEQAPEAVEELGLSFVTYFHSNTGPNGHYTMENMPLSRAAYAEAMAELQD
ncbi:cell wall-binding repeat-containing protein [Ornithinimicrobium faecis]|uniref:Cell wall-binding repeat-containing protein n=1 Tax=Ornithinimicrobium faecis TaxID=2934158 RepID=A0ABY4YWD0_9MICO|nr:cell wall-binding repeat-containing protein [Ornithinimicrobium sp. HY1793]USQ80457.1 cell wall-binding repeat-containing protein [Ornithinimicrobium sp. HY1793]